MPNIINIAKKIAIFLFGVFLIVWGYKVNAANSVEKAKEEKDSFPKKETEQAPAIPSKEEIKTVEEPISKPVEKAEATSQPKAEKEGKKKENKRKKDDVTNQTVIESDTPEKASGTE